MALVDQALGWVAASVEAVHPQDRTPEENELLRLVRLARSWLVSYDDSDPAV
jgi:hypothetical protein